MYGNSEIKRLQQISEQLLRAGNGLVESSDKDNESPEAPAEAPEPRQAKATPPKVRRRIPDILQNLKADPSMVRREKMRQALKDAQLRHYASTKPARAEPKHKGVRHYIAALGDVDEAVAPGGGSWLDRARAAFRRWRSGGTKTEPQSPPRSGSFKGNTAELQKAQAAKTKVNPSGVETTVQRVYDPERKIWVTSKKKAISL